MATHTISMSHHNTSNARNSYIHCLICSKLVTHHEGPTLNTAACHYCVQLCQGGVWGEVLFITACSFFLHFIKCHILYNTGLHDIKIKYMQKGKQQNMFIMEQTTAQKYQQESDLLSVLYSIC